MVKSNLAYKAQDTVVPEVVVNESPIKWCAVALSDVIARGKRLEASVFDVEAKQARSLIAKGKYTQSFIGGASGMASSYGKVLITRFTYGSVVDEIDDNHVRQIAIPLLKNHTVQKKINDLALEANEKRYQAYLLEQEALQIMDRDVIYAKK